LGTYVVVAAIAVEVHHEVIGWNDKRRLSIYTREGLRRAIAATPIAGLAPVLVVAGILVEANVVAVQLCGAQRVEGDGEVQCTGNADSLILIHVISVGMGTLQQATKM
jgi:hypothetical protein